tara:strand:- start:26370 stop:27575 length:1206 start_codon:yes stop_codon:yes gene_type:complete
MNILKKYIDFILLFFIISFFISDFATSIANKLFSGSFNRYSGVVKLLFEVVMAIMIVSNRDKNIKVIQVLFALLLCFLIGQFMAIQDEYSFKIQVLEGNIYYFNKYIYILIFILFIKSIDIKKQTFIKIFDFLIYFLFINSIMILLGLLFEIQLFRSYEYTERFGYSGFFSKPEEASFIYMIVIIYYYYLWVIDKKNKNLFKTLFWIFFALLIGKKAILFFLILIFLVHIIFIAKYRIFYRFLLPLIVLVFYIFRESIIRFMLGLFPFWINIYQQHGLLTTLSSRRDLLLVDAVNYIDLNWGIFNYIFGGIDISKYKVEFELVDLYMFLGVFGVSFYFYLIIFHFLKRSNFLKKALILIVFFTSLLSGGLILNITAVIIFYIVANYIMVEHRLALEIGKTP